MMFTLKAAALIAMMKADQWKSRDELIELQNRRLGKLLSYASENVPRYRGMLSSIRSVEDLCSVPMLEKEHVRDNPDALISRKFSKSSLKRLDTSGSTGLPLSVYIDRGESIWRTAMLTHAMSEAGLRPLERFGFVTYQKEQDQKLGFFRPVNFSMFDDEGKVLSEIRRNRISALRSYPSVLSMLAKKNLGLGRPVRLRLVLCGAETLTAQARDMIADSFGSQVRNFYGAVEVGRVAWECGLGRMHILSDSMIVEAADERGNTLPHGKTGRIVVTPLFQRSMPLIRYDLGDRGSLGSNCPCGRGSDYIKSLEGRHAAMLKMRSGRLCNSLPLDIFLRHFPGVLSFRGLQKEPGQLLLRIVASADFDEKDKGEIARRIASCFPEPMDIEVELVSRLSGSGYKLNCVEVAKDET